MVCDKKIKYNKRNRENMKEDRKKEIIMATLRLAVQKGLSGVSMSMIADEVGIRKPSLYNHFSSKEMLLEEMYNYLRDRATESTQYRSMSLDKKLNNKTAEEVLLNMVNGYIAMSYTGEMKMLYSVLYAERTINPDATKILLEESDKMINATKVVIGAMVKHNMLDIIDIDIVATTFAITVHGLMDMEADRCFVAGGDKPMDMRLIERYIHNFCKEHACSR